MAPHFWELSQRSRAFCGQFHQQEVTIEWLVNGKYDVKCVKIFQEEYHSASKLVLERGPVRQLCSTQRVATFHRSFKPTIVPSLIFYHLSNAMKSIPEF